MPITYEQAVQRLKAAGQEHLFQYWDRLHVGQRSSLLTQVEELDLEAVARMKVLLADRLAAGGHAGGADVEIEPAPPPAVSEADRHGARQAGEEALRAGRVGVLLVAGGQGSRLGFEGPKGCFPIGPVSGAPLFAVHARKILALQRRYGAAIPFYLMTSQDNEHPTRCFFLENNFFGLSGRDVLFFNQGMYPALWADGRIVLETPDRLFLAPDGHGGTLAALQRTGMLADMARRGLETIFYFQVDNPLVEVADPEFVGLHRLREAQVSLKVCAKRDPDEGLGVVVRRGGRHAMVEYSEMSAEQRHRRTQAGDLVFRHGSVAIHAFSVPFLAREANAGLPLHIAHKKVPFCDEAGNTVKPDTPNAWKFERFIFDTLPDADRVLVVEFRREDEFSPVKNKDGADSPPTAQRDLMEKCARWLVAAGVAVPRGPDGALAHRIEIDPCYADSAAALRARLPAGFRWDRDLFLEDKEG